MSDVIVGVFQRGKMLRRMVLAEYGQYGRLRSARILKKRIKAQEFWTKKLGNYASTTPLDTSSPSSYCCAGLRNYCRPASTRAMAAVDSDINWLEYGNLGLSDIDGMANGTSQPCSRLSNCRPRGP